MLYLIPLPPQGAQPSKNRADRRALISERADSGDASSVQNASLPYMPAKKQSTSAMKKLAMSSPPAHEAPPPPAPAVMIPRARLHPPHRDRYVMCEKLPRSYSILWWFNP
ncbi:hypothetical protein JYU34_019952 [Plutella xylostella]|uniref:Uncharacterized protein n=1 Tax=Plutella xylostella TaxID=51655 RepID=A0ABQ7PVL6_PLUXY|nr:hypothetical protein JYU34_019952 [Plutella xylostella]